MAALLRGLLGGKAQQEPINPAEEPDFVDFAGAPDPSPASSLLNSASSSLSAVATPTPLSDTPIHFRPYTKWYRVWERTSLNDFTSELLILPFIVAIVLLHLWGQRTNRRKARAWIARHAPLLQQEYAHVGFDEPPPSTFKSDNDTPSATSGPSDTYKLLKEKKITEYATYATGRQNVAFTDFKITLLRRHNPVGLFGEEAIGFFFESQHAPRERLEATSYVFDGREAELAPFLNKKVDADGKVTPDESKKEKFNSNYDGFVFAIAHKERMKQLREARYDLSLTSTKDHPRLPVWATVMSESAEVTETLLTSEMVKAVEEAGDAFEALVVSDMPVESPSKLDDLIPRKRVSISIRLHNPEKTAAIFRLFLRLPDYLSNQARNFRPEALRRVRATREEEARKIRKVFDDEKAEERRTAAEKAKKAEREAKLRGLSAEEQRKMLERERAGDLRKGAKKGGKK